MLTIVCLLTLAGCVSVVCTLIWSKVPLSIAVLLLGLAQLLSCLPLR